jgi:Uma2 family endonuclease
MTTEEREFVMWTPDPMRRRLADYTVEDILLLPDDAPRCEPTDGVITTHHYFDAEQVLLAVEIVSPGTRRRDRLEKPAVYAAAGVPHLWRIETDPVHVYAYDLVNGSYEAAGDSDEVLRLSKPFDIELQIGDITP